MINKAQQPILMPGPGACGAVAERRGGRAGPSGRGRRWGGVAAAGCGTGL